MVSSHFFEQAVNQFFVLGVQKNGLNGTVPLGTVNSEIFARILFFVYRVKRHIYHI